MALPAVVALGPLAIAANTYWALGARFRTGAASGAVHVCRETLSGLIAIQAAETWPHPVQSRVTARIPALTAELERVERHPA